MKKLMALQNNEAPSLSACRGDVTPAVEELYQKMIAKQPENRFQSMSEVAEELFDRMPKESKVPSGFDSIVAGEPKAQEGSIFKSLVRIFKKDK